MSNQLDPVEYSSKFRVAQQYVDNFQEILFTKEQIDESVVRLGEQITADYQNLEGGLVVIGLLKGCTLFFSDLIREIALPFHVDFISASSYGNSTVSSGQLKIIKDVDAEVIKGKHVLIVEDMADTGNTLARIITHLGAKEPLSIKLCVFLNKEAHRNCELTVDYVGYPCPDAFIVGYGLDFAEDYRQLPFCASLKPSAYEKK